ETFSADETGSDAGAYYMLEHTPEDVTVAEPLVARTRERRMIRDLVFDRKPTKPTIGEVYLHLTAQRPLRPDRKHVADDQHPDHERRIDRGPTDPGVIGRKLGMDPGQVKNGSNPANGMIVRYRLLKAERIKQLSLFVIEPPHHRPPPQRIASQRANNSTPKPSTTFATKSLPKRTLRSLPHGAAIPDNSGRKEG